METLSIEILNPKVRVILQQLADLKLIAIRNSSTQQVEFQDLLGKIRSIDPDGVSQMDIVAEQEIVRIQRDAKQKKD